VNTLQYDTAIMLARFILFVLDRQLVKQHVITAEKCFSVVYCFACIWLHDWQFEFDRSLNNS